MDPAVEFEMGIEVRALSILSTGIKVIDYLKFRGM